MPHHRTRLADGTATGGPGGRRPDERGGPDPTGGSDPQADLDGRPAVPGAALVHLTQKRSFCDTHRGYVCPEEIPMTRDRVNSLVGLCAGSIAIALPLSAPSSADPPSWNGAYAITFIVGPKSGTSIAAGQSEVQYTDTYEFRSGCTSGKCTATIVGGPAPRNPTVPQPVQFTWDG